MFRGPFLVAGPCALEDDETNLLIATSLAKLQDALGIRVIFKGSFDKANRSTRLADRGPGLEAGLRALARVREQTGLAVLTDVHETTQIAQVASVVDILQIPAFLCRQTDLLTTAGATGKPVNIKKGQWMDATGIAHAVEKVRKSGSTPVAVTERGTFFGYGDLVVDMRSFPRIQAAAGTPVIFDVTHSIQQPGKGSGGSSGGDRYSAPALARAAVAAGATGLFVETHPDPPQAPSDAESMWPLEDMRKLVEPCLGIWEALRQTAGERGNGSTKPTTPIRLHPS